MGARSTPRPALRSGRHSKMRCPESKAAASARGSSRTASPHDQDRRATRRAARYTPSDDNAFLKRGRRHVQMEQAVPWCVVTLGPFNFLRVCWLKPRSFSPDRYSVVALTAMKVAPTSGQQAEGRPTPGNARAGSGARRTRRRRRRRARGTPRAMSAARGTRSTRRCSRSAATRARRATSARTRRGRSSRRWRPRRAGNGEQLGLTRGDLKARPEATEDQGARPHSLFNHIDAKEQGALSEAQWVAAFRDEEAAVRRASGARRRCSTARGRRTACHRSPRSRA